MSVIDVTTAEFDEKVIEASKTQPIVVVFWAPWCGPCKVLKPMLEKLADEQEFVLARVNIEQEQALTERYMVRNVPTVIVLSAGNESARILGMVGESQLRSRLTAAGAIFE